MSAQPKPFISPEEYIRRERLAPFKSEYFNGQIFAMAGASTAHVRINSNLTGLLYQAFRGGPCYALAADMRVHVPKTGLYTYPDTIVLCEEPQLEDDDILLNPKIIFEVLSKSTERYDRGAKFRNYQTIDSLKEYILISQMHPHVDQFVLRPEGWTLKTHSGLDAVLELSSAPASIPLNELYTGVTLLDLAVFDPDHD